MKRELISIKIMGKQTFGSYKNLNESDSNLRICQAKNEKDEALEKALHAGETSGVPMLFDSNGFRKKMMDKYL